MSGTAFMGLIVESWTPDALQPVIKAVAAYLEETQDTSRPDAFELFVHSYKGAAWLTVWSAIEEPSTGLTRESLLAPVAKAAGSPVWLYQYDGQYELVLTITRVLASGERAAAFTMDVTKKEFRKRAKGQAEDAYTRVQDAAAAEIIKTVPSWTIEELRSEEGDYFGPEGVPAGENETIQLAPHITRRGRPAPPPPDSDWPAKREAWAKDNQARGEWQERVAERWKLAALPLTKAFRFSESVRKACQEPDRLQLQMLCAPAFAARELGSALLPMKNLAEALAASKLSAIPTSFSRTQLQRLKKIQKAPSSLAELKELLDAVDDMLRDKRVIWFSEYFVDRTTFVPEDGRELALQAVLLLLTLKRLQQLIPLAQPFLT